MPKSPRQSSTKYQRFEDDWSDGGGSGRFSSTSSLSSGRHGRKSGRKAQRQSSIRSTGSFSHSEEFKKVFDKKEGAAAADGTGKNAAEEEEEEEIYIVRQRYGYLSMLFSAGQVGVVAVMMLECGVAPLNINPMIGPYPDALSYWGGKNAVNILDDGEYWRLLTPIMLHAGIIHLLCNIAVQVETGAFFEREWGSRNWLIIYLTSAVGSSILSVIFMPDAISVGSSGAVMGIFGGKAAEVVCRCCDSDKSEQGRISRQVRKEQCAGVTCSITVVMLFSFIPYVDWAAHLGGCLAGFCVGLMVFSCDVKKMVWRLFWVLVGVGLTTMYFSITLSKMYSGDIDPADDLRDVCGYYKQYFEDYECNCMRDEQEN